MLSNEHSKTIVSMPSTRRFTHGLVVALSISVGHGFQNLGSARTGAQLSAMRSRRRSQGIRMSSDYLSNLGGQPSYREENPVYAPPIYAAASASRSARDEAGWLDKLNDKVDNGLGSGMLLAATAASIVLANSGMALAWLNFWDTPSGVAIGQHVLSNRLLVNEGFMAFFFFMVRRTAPDDSRLLITAPQISCIAIHGTSNFVQIIVNSSRLCFRAHFFAGWP